MATAAGTSEVLFQDPTERGMHQSDIATYQTGPDLILGQSKTKVVDAIKDNAAIDFPIQGRILTHVYRVKFEQRKIDSICKVNEYTGVKWFTHKASEFVSSTIFKYSQFHKSGQTTAHIREKLELFIQETAHKRGFELHKPNRNTDEWWGTEKK
ncbi:MAG: hypothetical protein ACPGUD_00935 [Parashewanella sp.]